MQIDAATFIACSAMARASRSVWRASAFAAASAYGPPDPMPTTPSSGSIEIARARQQEHRRLVEHDEHRLEPPQRAIGTPVLRELDRRALEVAAILLQLRLEAREQRERIGGRAGKPREDLVVVQAPDFLGALLDDRVAERHLAVARQHGAIAMPDGENRGGVDH